MTGLESLRDQLRTFAADRDWDQFHSPKNLAAALTAEAADVLLYLIRISDKLGIDLIAAANAKIILNAEKYPVDKARGSSKKYTEL